MLSKYKPMLFYLHNPNTTPHAKYTESHAAVS